MPMRRCGPRANCGRAPAASTPNADGAPKKRPPRSSAGANKRRRGRRRSGWLPWPDARRAPGREVEDLIALRNASGYEQATALLGDLGELAARNNAREAFGRQLAAVRARHASKRTFLARLYAAGLPGQ